MIIYLIRLIKKVTKYEYRDKNKSVKKWQSVAIP